MKRLLLKALAPIAALTVGTQLLAAPPANDNLADAQTLAGDFGVLIADTAEATLEDAESDLQYSYYGTNTVWYKWTSTAKEKIPFHLGYARLDDEYIPLEVSVFTGTSYEDLEEVDGSYYDFCAEPGKTYLIRLRSYKPGRFALRWYRDLAEGEWKILATDGIVFGAVGYLPEDLKATDFPAGVTEIAKGAFEDVEGMKFATIPATVTKIGDYAFGWASDLAWVDYEGDATAVQVADTAFLNTPYSRELPFKLIFDEWVYTNVEWDADHAVATTNIEEGCTIEGFVGTCPAELVIPEGVTEVYWGAFSGADTLVKVTFPSTLKYIEEYAFYGCSALESVAGIPASAEVEYWAFYGSLYETVRPFEFIIDEWTSPDYDSWDDEQRIYTKYTTNKWVIGFHGTCPEELTIPEGVYGIEYGAFSLSDDESEYIYDYDDNFDPRYLSLANLKKVTFASSVKEIYEYAFSYLPNLEDVVFLGNTMEYIDEYAFIATPYYCHQSTSSGFRLLADEWTREGYMRNLYDEYGNWTNEVWVAYDQPKHYLDIYGYVGTCPAKLDLTQYFTNSVDEVYIEDYAFAGVDTLTELVLPDAECYAYAAFRDCANLMAVTIGGDYAADKAWLTDNFKGTPWLDTVVPFELVTETDVYTNTWTEVVYSDGLNCCTLPDQRYTVVTNVDVVTRKRVVGYYGNVPAKLTFPDDVNVIGNYVFSGCDNITEIVVPGNVKYVGWNAFEYCCNLQSVEFQEGVVDIGEELFYGCGDGMQVILPVSAVVGYYDADADEWYGGDFEYDDVFCGINGDVDVVAPRTTRIYDRAFFEEDDDDYFGRVCVEYYTLVTLDANGGTFDGETEYRCFDDVVTGLPAPVFAGHVFREWRDEDGDMYRNGNVWGANEANVHLTAEWAVEKKYTVYGLDGATDVELGEGDDYETLVRVLEEAYGAEPVTSRHGLDFLYWTVDGVELNHRSAIGENSSFGAYFDEFNPLVANPDAAVDAAAAQTYDGYILDYKGNDAGTIQVKVGKPNKKTGEAKVSATVLMFGTKKLSFKADPKSSWKLAVGGSTKDVTLSSSAVQSKIVIDISEKGIFGTFGSYDIIGSRNTSKKDAAYANWVGRNYEVAFKTQEGTGSAFTGGYSGVTLSIAGKGKVKITGVMADGAKVSASAQLLISDTGEGCINAFVPMYSGKKGGFGFVLWIDPDYKTTDVESVSTWISTDSKTPFKAELEVVATSTPAPASAMTFTLEAAPTVSGRMLTDYLPTAVKVAFNGGKLTVAKANKIKLDKSSGAPIRTGATDNDAGLKLSYVAKTGSFKGSFTVYSVVNSKLKKYKATVNGVFVNNVGYGTAVIKGVGSFPVVIR